MPTCLCTVVRLGRGEYVVVQGLRVRARFDLEEPALELAGLINGPILGWDARPQCAWEVGL